MLLKVVLSFQTIRRFTFVQKDSCKIPFKLKLRDTEESKVRIMRFWRNVVSVSVNRQILNVACDGTREFLIQSDWLKIICDLTKVGYVNEGYTVLSSSNNDVNSRIHTSFPPASPFLLSNKCDRYRIGNA